MKVTTDTIGKEKIDIHVDSSGHFWAEYEDERYEDETRKALLEKLAKAVKRHESEKAVRVTLVDVQPTTRKSFSYGPYEPGRGVLHARLRGKHGREWNAWLFVSEDGKTKFKMASHNGGFTLCPRLSAEQVAEYERLSGAIETAKAAYAEWLKGVEVTPEEALKLD